MISTVTTTVTTVTIVSGTLGGFTSLLLILLLSGKEVSDAGESGISKVIGQNLKIAIIPLFLTFIIIVGVNVILAI